ncbi:hypothetical protein C9J44_17025 [Photobacterium sp. GB-27]|uniref:DUF6279 family lipoprotein n=1 Tax=Photobacterium sp. GB-27 TaxID=2022109 RepID=UPI000D174AAC|nr:DUF6279 family lipoprotein [Photobacterium sp. GB-27]PSV33903.1 hypothetical protein C9J44_17025 [Photobacterium sp. GB-27]
MLKRTISIIFICVVLSSCTFKLVYNSLDFWIDYYLSDYLDLDSQQQGELEQGLETALAQHRQQQLAVFHKLISALQIDLKKPLTAEQIANYHQRFTQAGEASVLVFVSPIIDVVKTMSPSQIAASLQAIEKEIIERREERLSKSPKQRLEDRYDELEDKAQKWIGRLTKQQKQLILSLAQLQLQQSTIFQNIATDNLSQLKRILKQRNNAQFSLRVEQQVKNILSLKNAVYQTQLDEYLSQRFVIMKQLNESLSPQQLRHLQGELTSLRKDIATLIQKK